ncbi:MAG: hypothetical protein JWR69_742 [Pedosphaera sp.]|nr:hypothetical protein [Pedosphaera sp.]
MNYPQSIQRQVRNFRRLAVFAMIGAAGLRFATGNAPAQTTNAFDVAANAAYAGAGAPNGLSPGGQNGGSGFGPWTFTVNGNGGAFTSGTGPSGASWDLWNTAVNGSTVAVRPFSSPLVAGQSFSVQLRLNSLDRSYTTNTLVLQDASGNAIFRYWHVGFEPNGAVNGSYADATTNNGVAVGFSYNYQQFCTFTFTLNSATTYTFTDNTTGHSFSGVISGSPIAQVAFVRGNGSPTAPPNGQDFQIDMLKIVSSAPPSFQLQTPAAGSFSASPTNAISVQVVAGGTPINTGSIAFKIDGNAVTSAVSTVSGVTTVTCHPSSPLSPGVAHTAEVTLADNNNGLFTNTWSFTTGFPSLPATLPGPISVGGGNEVVIFTAAGEGWLGTNYDANSNRTLFTRYSMAFHDLNGETGGGGGYGGLHFFQGNTEHLITGNSWLSLNWSLDTLAVGELDLSPGTPVVLEEWHTVVERIDYAPGGSANVKVWLDPDFSQTEVSQPNAPISFAMDNTFNNVRLRCGNGTASASFTNIMMAALGTGIGFATPVEAQIQGLVPGANAVAAAPSTPVGFQVVVGGVGIRTNDITLSLDGGAVTPVFTTPGNTITVSYQPVSPFTPGSTHSVSASLTDTNGTPYATTWAFTVDTYPSLPITLAGPYDANEFAPVILFTGQNGWIGGNYDSTSTKTLYTRFSMSFSDLNGKTGSGGAYGGLHFFQDNNERLLVGDAWTSPNWSADAKEFGEPELPPVTPIVLDEWHTMATRIDYVAGQSANVKVWLDPDFSKTESNQPNGPLLCSLNNTFNNVRLRCGNGTASAHFTNIVIAATGPEVGFAVQPPVAVLSIQNSGGGVNLSWTSVGTLLEAPAVSGPWIESGNQANPQVLATTNSVRFFRVRQ